MAAGFLFSFFWSLPFGRPASTMAFSDGFLSRPEQHGAGERSPSSGGPASVAHDGGLWPGRWRLPCCDGMICTARCKICRILRYAAGFRCFHHMLSDGMCICKPLYSKGLQHPSAFVPPDCAISRQIPLVFIRKTQHIVSAFARSTIFCTTLPEIHTAAVFGVIIQKKHEPDELWHTGAVLQGGGRNHGGDQNFVGGQP